MKAWLNKRRWIAVFILVLAVVGISAWVLSPVLFLSPELPPQLQAQRDLLIMEADKKIREGLVELAAKYPQVQETMEGFHELDAFMRSHTKPTIHPYINIRIGNTQYPFSKIPQSERFKTNGFNISIPLSAYDHWPPRAGARPFGVQHVFANLQIGAYRGMFYAAVDPQLDRDIKQLIDGALAPLAALDAQAGHRKPWEWPVANAYPVTHE